MPGAGRLGLILVVSGDIQKLLQRQVLEASRCGRPLNIIGGASKSFYGREARGAPLRTAAHRGVLCYDPAELVVTARAGTRLAELEDVLASSGQMLGFEPPRFSVAATVGGAVAVGLAGPRRPYAGAVRDFILGVKMLNGKGEILRFGGEVMKNVAGFDISRLMAGAMGTLGVLLEVSFRLIPRSPEERTLVLEQPDPGAALALFSRLARQPLPLSAAAWQGGETRIRLSASIAGVDHAARIIGGEPDPRGREFWRRLRDHELPFFLSERPLLRVSMPPAADLRPPEAAPRAAQFIDWGGAQRWVAGAADIGPLREAVAAYGGHISGFRHTDRQGAVFQPLPPSVHALHLSLKRAFDPLGILNPGRLYPDL